MKYIKSIFYMTFLFLFVSNNVLSRPGIIFVHWNGKEYSENAQLQEAWAERFFFKKYHFNGNEVVLDIGSGDGKITARIADAVPQGKVIGIDNSKSMLTEANKHQLSRHNLKFIFQDAQDREFYYPFPNTFDLVVSFTVLHWIKDQHAVLDGIYHVLKPNGKFYLRISSKGGDPIQDIADKLKDSSKYGSYFTFFQDPMHRFDEMEYKRLIKDANLQLISVIEIEEQDKIESKQKLIKQIKSWLPHYHFLKSTNADLAENFINEVIDTYLYHFPIKADGSIVLLDHYIEVVGSKGEAENIYELST